MKKTKEALKEAIKSTKLQANIKKEDAADQIIDLLIRDGWVELDKPREFWIVVDSKDDGKEWVIYSSEKAHHLKRIYSDRSTVEIIHVREVIDKDQCSCQKIKIGSHLNGSDIIHIDDVPYYIDNDCPIHGGKDNE